MKTRSRRWLASLYEGYRLHHSSNERLLEWIGLVGGVGFSVLYLLRFTGKLPPLYNDLPFRAVVLLCCAALALRRWWPQRLRPYYLPFSYAAVLYSLAFFIPFTLLQNQGGTPSVVNSVVSAVMIILLTDWRNTIVMMVTGYLASIGVFWLAHPEPRLPVEFLVWWIPLVAALVAGGSISKYFERRAELERLRRLYTGIAGSIAHEMRNPMAQVQHALDSIASQLDAPGGAPGALAPERLAELHSTIRQGRQAIVRGLQAIQLTLQQLKPGELDPAGFRLVSAADCVRRALDEYAWDDDGQRAKVDVQVAQDFLFSGDQTAFMLVLFNLLKNALHYTPMVPGARVSIVVGARPRQVTVRDTGPGIAPELLPLLFGEFQTAGKVEGTGLGLAFCRRVMHAFGGEIGCRSEPGLSTEFTMEFPPPAPGSAVAPPSADGAAAVAPTPPGLAGRTVLVVDDQGLNRAIARMNLGQLGVRVLEAEHGQRALELLRAGARPDAILMDVNMPGLSGLETTRALRASGLPSAGVPVLALTGNASAALAEAASAAGLQGLLAKPMDLGLLASELQRLLPVAAAPTAVPDPGAVAGLLDAPRIAGIERVGLLHELLPQALAEIQRLVERLRAQADARDLAGCEDSLHSLLGISGEAGAPALSACTRRHYQRVLGGDWPEGAWTAELEALAEATRAALAARYLPAATAPTTAPAEKV